MRYSIGDVSRVLGMTTSALHFYEKEGIIDTPKVESGWRYYQEADVCRLISAKKYRAMGVPLQEIARQFDPDGMTAKQVLARMKEKQAEAERAARQYARLAEDIGELIACGGHGIGTTGVVDIRQTEDMMCFVSSSGGCIPLDKQEQAYAKHWLEAVPAVKLGICRDKTEERAVHALIVAARRAEEYGLVTDAPGVRLIPGGMALHAVVTCGEERFDDPDVIFGPILAFAREHQFAQKGTMWGSVLFADCSGETKRHYYDTYMTFL